MIPFRIPTRDDFAPRLTGADRHQMMLRALPLMPDDALAYAPLARTWLVRQGVPAYEIDAGVVARELLNERERRAVKCGSTNE